MDLLKYVQKLHKNIKSLFWVIFNYSKVLLQVHLILGYYVETVEF